ncbi:hypothetical protein [Tabrizicola sp.]|jgi:hypothetical protein|uniref:hypothetical protein n=1 Tax=Tabrizicola sp. TaxID=2005166 RepID=UPI001A62B260|nr:hypothetical protein [Tabrizicola sp.]MBL9062818.1 hypothetical protein [Tabrizicola sp.]
MIDGRFDQHFLEIFAQSPARRADDAHVSRVLAVSIILVAAILAGWLGLKPGPDAIIRADQWNAANSDTGSRP